MTGKNKPTSPRPPANPTTHVQASPTVPRPAPNVTPTRKNSPPRPQANPTPPTKRGL